MWSLVLRLLSDVIFLLLHRLVIKQISLYSIGVDIYLRVVVQRLATLLLLIILLVSSITSDIGRLAVRSARVLNANLCLLLVNLISRDKHNSHLIDTAAGIFEVLERVSRRLSLQILHITHLIYVLSIFERDGRLDLTNRLLLNQTVVGIFIENNRNWHMMPSLRLAHHLLWSQLGKTLLRIAITAFELV